MISSVESNSMPQGDGSFVELFLLFLNIDSWQCSVLKRPSSRLDVSSVQEYQCRSPRFHGKLKEVQQFEGVNSGEKPETRTRS